jgi:hypothetical protein
VHNLAQKQAQTKSKYGKERPVVDFDADTTMESEENVN